MRVLAAVSNPLSFIPAMVLGGFAWFQWQISVGRRERDFVFFLPAEHRTVGLALAGVYGLAAIIVLVLGFRPV